MRNFIFIFTMIFIFVSAKAQIQLGGNQSNGSISTSISNPPSTTGEAFRFRPGIVTQLDQGTFGFSSSDRWWSLGRLNTGSQTVFGLRLQNGQKALTLGYNDVANDNPRIQWIGENGDLGNLEFRVANSFTSTNSDLVATMRDNGTTVFGIPTRLISTGNFNFLEDLFQQAKVGVGNGRNNIADGEKYGIEVITYGILDDDTNNFFGGSFLSRGVDVSRPVAFDATNRTGVLGRSINGLSGIAIGVSGLASSGNMNYSIYGQSTTGINTFAGFFDGDVEVTGNLITASDRKLKDNIESEADNEILTKLNQLNPVTYTFKENKNVTLGSGLQHGLIAQELEEVFPELVQDIKKPILDEEGNVTGQYEFKSVRYQDLISILIQSVKELSSEMEVLKGELQNKEQTFVLNENSSLSTEEKEALIKEAYYLGQNYPNPFEGRSVIEYALPEASKNASILIFDMTGSFLKEYKLQDLKGKIEITADEFGAGMYLYSLVDGGREIISKKMIVK